MKINESVFKPNDVRGIYGIGITEELFYKIARAFVSYFNCKKVIVGRDMRISSPSLSKAFIKGIIDSGADAIDIGIVSSDVVYFASGFLKKYAVMITSSHNPAENNGIKFLKKGAVSINQASGLDEIKRLVIKNKFKKAKKKGKVIKKNILEEYKQHVLNFINVKNLNPIKVVVDAGNGMAGKIVPLIYSGLPIKIIPMYFKLNGKFPNHVPNPLIPANNKMLLKRIKSSKADFGMAFDGDADRVFFADEKGRMIESSISSCILIKNMLLRNKGKKIIYNSILSKIVPETIRKYGGKAFLTKVGHSIIKNNMKKKSALFACEHSGHFYFKKNYNADSGIIASLIMCEIMSNALEKNMALSHLTSEFEKYFKSNEYNIKVRSNKEKMDRLERLEKFYRKKRGVKKISRFNGLSVWLDKFWFNVRPSDTESVLRINLEADNLGVMKEEFSKLKKRAREI